MEDVQLRFEPRYPEENREDAPYGEARPIPPQQEVRVRLPTGQPRAVWVLLAINILLFLVSNLLSFILDPRSCAPLDTYSCALFLLGWKQNSLIDQGQYWRLVTAMFLHGGLLHIFFNGYALFVLGPETERIFGTLRFLALYFVAGLAGSVASYAFSPSPSVGASGAIFGLVGALGAFFYLARDVLGDAGRAQLQSMIFIVVINLAIGFGASGVIDNYAHIGGLIGGVLAGVLLAPRYVIDHRFYPPVVARQFHTFGWFGVAGLFVLLALLTFMI
ncbi:MAG: rhomboid family intramembrane serine protease [Chloroflexaceae bacterium]